MTRASRAIRFPRAFPISLIAFTALTLPLLAGHAFADDAAASPILAQAVSGAAANVATTSPAPGGAVDASTAPIVLVNPVPGGAAASNVSAAAVTGGMADVSSSATNANQEQAGIQLLPSVERPLHYFYCAEYARLRSGFPIFGDAKTWWARAANAYAKLTEPVTDAVMVFASSKRIRRGHVAVVTQVVSAREIRVDQANWQNRGEIDKATPVLDVSPNNDWSVVRVWDMASGQFGARIYAIRGFIARALVGKS